MEVTFSRMNEVMSPDNENFCDELGIFSAASVNSSENGFPCIRDNFRLEDKNAMSRSERRNKMRMQHWPSAKLEEDAHPCIVRRNKMRMRNWRRSALVRCSSDSVTSLDSLLRGSHDHRSGEVCDKENHGPRAKTPISRVQWAFVEHSFSADRPEELSIKRGQHICVLQEILEKKWCLVCSVNLRAGWVPVSHLGTYRTTEIEMLSSLRVAIQKHDRGVISTHELERICCVYQNASTQSEPAQAQFQFLKAVEEANEGISPPVVLCVIRRLIKSGNVPREEAKVAKHKHSPLNHRDVADSIAIGTQCIEIEGIPTEDEFHSAASEDAECWNSIEERTGSAIPTSHGITSNDCLEQDNPDLNDFVSPQPSECILEWLTRTLGLSVSESGDRLHELTRFGFSAEASARALAEAHGDLDRATLALVYAMA